jgi:hypothetical protein
MRSSVLFLLLTVVFFVILCVLDHPSPREPDLNDAFTNSKAFAALVDEAFWYVNPIQSLTQSFYRRCVSSGSLSCFMVSQMK